MPQKARLRSLERFSSPETGSTTGSILIATDVAARGLDIKDIALVIHYHVPRSADAYVHRSGRTARATQTGRSILLSAPDETLGVQRLIAKVHARASASKRRGPIRSLHLDRTLLDRLRPRVALAKRIADSLLAKEKTGKEDDWLRTAASDLGVDYDSEEFAATSERGKGQARKKKEREASKLSKGEVRALRGELKALLARRVNVGVSERYVAGGRVDVAELLERGVDGNVEGLFLGDVEGLDFGD